MHTKTTAAAALVVREYDAKRDRKAVEEVENRCEVGPTGKLSLYTDLLGDPICRVRHSPASLMLVAEMVVGGGGEIVGMIRGCIKTVTCGSKASRNGKSKPPHSIPVCTKLAYILGLRVSPSHRKMGIGLKLVTEMEKWAVENGAEYSYIATENDNLPSLSLFTDKCGYSKFRSPAILVHPVFAHRLKITTKISVIKLTPADAETLYRRRFTTTEFFPRDIDSVLNNNLNLGTFLAVPTGSRAAESWAGAAEFLTDPPQSWAVLSVWNCKETFTLQVRGASRVQKVAAAATRAVDRALPWLRLPSVPAVFRPFGLLFLYGVGGDGADAAKYVKALCGWAHNLAAERRSAVVATEVASGEPLRSGIPHWKSLSCAEDLWCIKRLGEGYRDGGVGDWTKSPPGASIFVDPREF